jgi:hypothetical protein
MNDLMNPSYANTRRFVAEGMPIWAHWTYDPNEHRQFAKLDWDRIRRSIRRTFLLVAGLSVLPILGGLVLILATEKGSGLGTVFLLYSGLAILVTAINWLWYNRSALHIYTARRRGPHEITITPTEIIEAGIKTAIVGISRRLTRVYIHSQDLPTLSSG